MEEDENSSPPKHTLKNEAIHGNQVMTKAPNLDHYCMDGMRYRGEPRNYEAHQVTR